MKALSIKQPWAWLVAAGYKDIENRGWKRNFKGRIYIHSGQQFDRIGLKTLLSSQKELLDERAQATIKGLARSWKGAAIIGEVDIVDCVTHSESPWFIGPYGFVLANPVLYDRVLPCKGRTFFFEPDI